MYIPCLLQIYCDRSIISPIQVQYDAISFENGFQSKMTTGTLLGNFRRASIDSIGWKLEYANAEQICFRKWKKDTICLQRCTQCGRDLVLGVPNLSEVKYPTAESHLVKNCTYISGSHHDVYLVQFSNYSCSSHFMRDGNFGNLKLVNHAWSSQCHPLDVSVTISSWIEQSILQPRPSREFQTNPHSPIALVTHNWPTLFRGGLRNLLTRSCPTNRKLQIP